MGKQTRKVNTIRLHLKLMSNIRQRGRDQLNEMKSNQLEPQLGSIIVDWKVGVSWPECDDDRLYMAKCRVSAPPMKCHDSPR